MQKPVQEPFSDPTLNESDTKNFKDPLPLNPSPSSKIKEVLYSLPDSAAIVIHHNKKQKHQQYRDAVDENDAVTSSIQSSGAIIDSKAVDL